MVEIRPELVQSFYDNKGDFTKMNLQPQDRERFIAGTEDIGAVLAMPDNPTREAWGQAKDQYKQMNAEIEKKYGAGIHDKISDYYNDPNHGYLQNDSSAGANVGSIQSRVQI